MFTITSSLYSFWNFQTEYSRLSYFWHVTEHLNFSWQVPENASSTVFFLECALILYKERRFSYEHLCTLSFFTGLLQCFINSGLNSEFRDFKLWDQKLQFKGFVSEILLEYFSGILWHYPMIFFYLRVLIHILIIFLWDSQILYKWVPELTKTVDICSRIYYRLMTHGISIMRPWDWIESNCK